MFYSLANCDIKTADRLDYLPKLLEIMLEINIFFEFKALFSEIRSFLAFIKENHGGVFKRVAFSSMLEPFIKLNQEINLKNMKLKEIDQRLNELDMFKTLLNNLRDSLSTNKSIYLTQSSIIKSNKSSENLINEEEKCNFLLF